jgi:hypothetical protein
VPPAGRIPRRADIAAVLGADFVDAKIDVDRMDHGKEVMATCRKGEDGSIPWFVILDGQGKALATSDGPKGNIGYPAQPHGIEHFLAVLKQTARKDGARAARPDRGGIAAGEEGPRAGQSALTLVVRGGPVAAAATAQAKQRMRAGQLSGSLGNNEVFPSTLLWECHHGKARVPEL